MIRIGREIQCLPYAGFLIQDLIQLWMFANKAIFRDKLAIVLEAKLYMVIKTITQLFYSLFHWLNCELYQLFWPDGKAISI